MIRNSMIAATVGLMGLVACGGNADAPQTNDKPAKEKKEWTAYGEAFKPKKGEVLNMKQLGEKMESDGGAEGFFKAEIVQTCTKMGCWMNVKGPAGDTIMVYMKDHDFFVPKDGVQGNQAVISGKAYYDTVSVDMQKHLLEDAGAPQADIDAITTPKFEMAIEAAGVMIADVPADAPIAGDEEEEHDHHDHGDHGDHEHEDGEAHGEHTH